MGTIRRKKHSALVPITDAAIAAFRAGDWETLHAELHLPPWCCGNDLIDHPFGSVDKFGREYLPWYRREAVRAALLAAA